MKREIIELQNNAINSLLSYVKQGKKDITLKAPTGSGKTYMMSSLMNKILEYDKNVVFIVSIPSKGKLAEQNFNRFVELSFDTFKNLEPFYICSGTENDKNKEYSLHIDQNCNVFVLPTAQYTESSRIKKERSLLSFLEFCKKEGRKIILVRDESHIATNKINSLKDYFSQTINFSATPTDDKFDVCISEDEAIEANLIKSVEYFEEEQDLKEGLTQALNKFKEIRPYYIDKGITPAFIVQVSNENDAQTEVEIIKSIVEDKGLNWVYFVEKESGYESNTRIEKIKNKSLWQNYVKEHDFPIDVIIFKLVITEGFDIPRACMLYQVRNSQSKQLDEQVIGRVRRNPCLATFETLDKKTQEIFSKAYVYGIKPKEEKEKKIKTKLKGEIHSELLINEIISEFNPFHITALQEVPLDDIDISDCLDEKNLEFHHSSIFQIYKELQNTNDKVKEKQREFITDFSKWFLFGANLKAIKDKVASVEENYEKYGKVIRTQIRDSVYSFFNKQGESVKINNWIWTNEKNSFCFDSEAEEKWFNILDTLAIKYCKTIEINDQTIYLFGKNFLEKSNIKYDYYYTRRHTSYPDFIFKDKKDNIHIFEVKSINKNKSIELDEEEYKEKIKKLKKAYKYASKNIKYTFYIPIQTENTWRIWWCKDGEEQSEMTEKMFIEYMKKLHSSTPYS